MLSCELSVVVCTYGRTDLVFSCLESLARQELASHLFEVIVVDNNRTCLTHDIVEGFEGKIKRLRFIWEPEAGVSNARNRGWKEAAGKIVAYIDDDAKAAPDWCSRILGAFETVSPRPAAVGGKILSWYEEAPPAWFGDELELGADAKARFLPPPEARYGFSGGNMAFPRGVLEKYGGFSSNFGPVGDVRKMGEDTEFFFRIYPKESHFWFDPAIIVHHWLPKEKMTPTYKFYWGFKTGESKGAMWGRRLFSWFYFLNFLYLLWTLFSLPLLLLRSRSCFMRGWVRWLSRFGYRLGVVFGRPFQLW